MFSRAMVFPYVLLYVLALGGEPEQVGIVYALGPLGGLLAIRCAIGVAAAFFSPAMGALLADIVPSAIRGRVMAAIGRGSVSVGSSSGGTGGPGTGFLTTLPLMVAALFGGVLYAWSPAIPFLCVFGLTVVALGVSVAFVRDPKMAEE